MGRMMRFMDTMTQAGLFLADPATSQAGRGAQTPTAQAPGHAAAVYQTPGALPVGGAQSVTAATPEPRLNADGDPQKLLDRWTRLHSPVFRGERHEDAQDFIDRCRDRLHNMRILESHRVDFTIFQLEGTARRWWQSYFVGRPAYSPPKTWSQFTQFFLDRYIPPFEREELQYQFEQLEQGYRQRGREQMQQDKRARFSGEFRGAPARGRGQIGRGQPSRPTYSAPLPPRCAPTQPYFSAMPESSYRPPVHQGSSSAYFNDMPESSYRPPAIQGSSSSLGEHEQHLRVVLQTLLEQELYAKFSKCYYRRFVEGFSSIAAPLTRLTQKGAPFRWSDVCEAIIQKLKTSLTTTPEGRVIAYASRQLKIHEKNYPVHDLELAAIILALKILRYFLYGVPCEVYIDRHSLQHLFKQRDLNLRLCRWLELLKDYGITILYHSGKAHVVVDALSRKAESMGRLYVPDVDGLRERILEEAHSSRYSIHPGSEAGASSYLPGAYT
ncbi:uncharacterized protein [Nicotiana tomentosiformis]|uniref:uncharacterized protein n=1 Tax=Nicotiana tomentosiformis TaxID=4098 RepID=UPI00388C631C